MSFIFILFFLQKYLYYFLFKKNTQLHTRTSKDWKCKPGGWDALNTSFLESDVDFPELYCDKVSFDFVVNCNDYRRFRPGGLISTFLDDYHLERFWNNPISYANRFAASGCAIMSPDYSLLIGMPRPMQIWNTFRNRFIGHIFSRHGCNVVPTITWSDSSSFDFCFSGIKRGSIVAVSNIGASSELHDAFFSTGYNAMIKAIEPKKIIFMANKKFGPRYKSDNIIFINSFFQRQKLKWAEEQERQ